MIIKYNTVLLNRIIKNIYDLTGVSISVLDTKYNLLANCKKAYDYCSVLQKTERLHCRECDMKILEKCRNSMKLEKHICFAGLYDAAMPIIKNDTIVCFAIMGRIRSSNSPIVPHLPSDIDDKTTEKLQKLYNELPFITEEKLMSLYDLLSFVIFDSAIQIVYDPLTSEIINFIEANLCEKLTINDLCSRFHVSKNSLYKAFNDNLGSTVNMYITEQRLNCAKELLLKTKDPVYMISRNAGIENYAYFCRLFKEKNGITPTQYRKTQNIN
ncbi:MAG: PocR ligand-binding domain-containing protein [Clostridia bacterium]|nr:PocR ligand-binding domain-containing protein [Clostridia bacterium]